MKRKVFLLFVVVGIAAVLAIVFAVSYNGRTTRLTMAQMAVQYVAAVDDEETSNAVIKRKLEYYTSEWVRAYDNSKGNKSFRATFWFYNELELEALDKFLGELESYWTVEYMTKWNNAYDLKFTPIVRVVAANATAKAL